MTAVREDRRAKRCTDCDVSWPLYDSYDECPLCGKSTWLADGEQPLSPVAAKDLRATVERTRRITARFDDWYWERELAIMAGEPLPDPPPKE